MQLAKLLDLAPITGLVLVMFLILVLPRLFERLKMPGIIGLLLAGFILGPKAMGLIEADQDVLKFLSGVGKLMVMFFAGLEIDFEQFTKHWKRSVIFGSFTFIIPLTMGFTIAMIAGIHPLGSVVVGSLLASHTLVGFPILQKKGVLQNRAVTSSVGATIFTDIGSLMVLGICVSIFSTGFNGSELGFRFLGMALYFPIVLFGSRMIAKRVMPRLQDNEEQKTMLMILIMAAAAGGAEIIHLEGIIGAFIAGLAVGEVVRTGETKEKLETLGHTLFIPMFFLMVGTLIDPLSFTRMDVGDLIFAISIVVGLIVAKGVAAAISAKILGFTKGEGAMMWALSVPQVAATLAAALVAYETVNSEGQTLISEVVLDTALVLMAVTAVLGPVLTEFFAPKIDNKLQ